MDSKLQKNNYLTIYDKFIEKIVDIASDAQPASHHHKKPVPTPCIWWNRDCKKALKKRKQKFRI